ncbi:MAG: nucleoside triphosphate pyrophosphohydrolase [Alphaproteobacteria bacterium]|nr:nucleoside triphosphate pyrophosphohydrolase [Alphaproteobacteria bacterium]
MDNAPQTPAASETERLLDIMARLRDPDTGCPWDREQSFATIAPYTIEEAYEVAEAITAGDRDLLLEELGDLLFQVVFYAQMASERGWFNFADVARAVGDKMIRRHPHVFGDMTIATSADQVEAWEVYKKRERAERAAAKGQQPSALDGVPPALPGLTRALKLQRRAARVGFDWPKHEQILDKLAEEFDELRAELADGDKSRIADEMGDVLFSWVNLARVHDVDPEDSLRRTNAKFERRFRRIEALLGARGKTPQESTLAEMEALWQRAKSEERAAPANPMNQPR